MANLRLSEIWIYPIKSLAGIRISKAKVFEKGLQYDRRMMLMDANGKFMTQRTNPQMALFKTKLDDSKIIVSHQSGSQQISLEHSTSEGEPVTIWHDTIQAVEVDPKKSNWFSALLGIKCRLVFFPEENSRAVDKQYAVNGEQVSLADGYPFLIIGQASLDDLNQRLKEKLPINRFRSNFVFTGGIPYEEDQWQNFSIGKNRFVGVKNCSRCTIPTVNQETGEKGEEPLKTLSTYRKRDNKIYFGQNVVAVDHTEVAVGDEIIVN